MRPNLSNAEEIYETRNIRREEVYIEAKIKTHNARMDVKHELFKAGYFSAA